jgi:acyl dehydratase
LRVARSARSAEGIPVIHGGGGSQTRELPIERWYRQVRLTRIYEGTDEMQRLIISRDLLRGVHQDRRASGMRVFSSVEDLAKAVGETIGPGEPVAVEQDRVNLFADATGDHQWIHVDPERAAAGPFGGTVAHGYLTLSLIPVLMQELYRVEGVRMAVNYGLNKVRFPAPVRVGSAVRASVELLSMEPVAGGYQLAARVTVTADGAGKPCCVAETLSRVYPA